MTTKRQSEEAEKKWSPVFTIRLEPELAERLRVASFTHRKKKQPILRDAVEKLLAHENARTDAAIRKHWGTIAAGQPEHTPMKEALRLSPAQDALLRRFAYEYRLHKQTIMRQALVEYLDHLDTAAAKRKR
jgi:predicted transcriptional regulator